jgi:hypothetical protein
MLIYQRFLSGAEEAGANPEAAEEHLRDVMKEAIDRKARRADTRKRGGFLAWVSGVAFPRPAWAAAAAIVLVAAAVVWRQPWTTEQTVLRGDDGLALLHVEPSQILKNGDVTLSWHPLADADGYLIHIRSAALEQIALFGPLADTTHVFDPDSLPSGTPQVLLWRVVALRAGDEIGRSQPASLQLP